MSTGECLVSGGLTNLRVPNPGGVPDPEWCLVQGGAWSPDRSLLMGGVNCSIVIGIPACNVRTNFPFQTITNHFDIDLIGST